MRTGSLLFALVSVHALAACDAPPTQGEGAPVVPAALGTITVGAPFVRNPDPGVPYVPPAYTFGAPAQPGTLDLPAVAAEVDRRVGRLERCYARRLAVKPGLAGTVVIHWTIAETGQVLDACVTDDTVGDPEVSGCVNALVREGGFPAPRGGAVDVSFPFVFTAGAATAIALGHAGR